MHDQHTHCACNGVYLCNTCHAWAHAHPFDARRFGWIISRHVGEPTTVAVSSAWGERYHSCSGEFIYIQEQP